MDTELDERKRKILKAIIQTYLETGEPVGSRTISKYTDLNLSSATIRNEMSDLEEMGYILQPHTSAGRIPSDKGYRLYVDELMREKEQEVADIKNMVSQLRNPFRHSAEDKQVCRDHQQPDTATCAAIRSVNSKCFLSWHSMKIVRIFFFSSLSFTTDTGPLPMMLW